MKLAGEAVRDYTDAYGGNRMLAFGISSWGCVKKNDILEAALEEVGLYFVYLQIFLNFQLLGKAFASLWLCGTSLESRMSKLIHIF